MKVDVASSVLACVAMATAPAFAVAASSLPHTVGALLDYNSINVHDDGRAVTIEWQCPGIDWEVTFCIVGSTRTYWTVFEAIRDKKLDVTGRLLNFRTRMHRHAREGKNDDIVLLAASWDGTRLMRTDWRSTSIGSAIDGVIWVQADQHFPTGWGLGEVCNGLYGNSPLFCALAKLSSRR